MPRYSLQDEQCRGNRQSCVNQPTVPKLVVFLAVWARFVAAVYVGCGAAVESRWGCIAFVLLGYNGIAGVEVVIV